LETAAVKWEYNNIPLKDTVTIVEGDSARKIYSQFENLNEGKVFSQGDKEYTVYVFVILPHEKLAESKE
jgi:hypothetical protein